MKKEEQIPEPAVLVGLNTRREEYEKDLTSLEELSLLAETAGFAPKATFLQKKDRIDPACYIGSGKAQELKRAVSLHSGTAVLFDFELTAVQIRNLEKILQCRIITRTEVILNIFEKRARTKEAQLQVELATLMYSLPRLRHMWPHLNRIAGYIGARGPGEKQIESDRRRISKRIHKIEQELLAVKTHRMVMRKGRAYRNKAALVGYTNTGKSSLLNALSHATLYTENRLFSTLDPATRAVWLGDGMSALVTDTVGFIKRLPHTLIASFRATLEEVREADILLHVADISSPDTLERIAAVNEVLKEISADTVPVLLVFNKTDLLASRDTKASLLSRFENRVLVSAKTGEGLPELKAYLRHFFRKSSHQHAGVWEIPLRGARAEAAGEFAGTEG
jgi:GTP-binding protein HflX